MECFAAERVAQDASPQVIEELEGIVRVETNHTVPLTDTVITVILSADSDFHRRLAELSMNERVARQVALVLCYVPRLDTICTQSVPGWLGHQEIVGALRARQPKAAKEAMAKHIDVSRDKMLRLFGA